jgi:hypothetical protein
MIMGDYFTRLKNDNQSTPESVKIECDTIFGKGGV